MLDIGSIAGGVTEIVAISGFAAANAAITVDWIAVIIGRSFIIMTTVMSWDVENSFRQIAYLWLVDLIDSARKMCYHYSTSLYRA